MTPLYRAAAPTLLPRHLRDVRERVQEIRDAVADDGHGERAHVLEVQLFEDVLRVVSEGARNAKGLAREALKSKGVGFARFP